MCRKWRYIWVQSILTLCSKKQHIYNCLVFFSGLFMNAAFIYCSSFQITSVWCSNHIVFPQRARQGVCMSTWVYVFARHKPAEKEEKERCGAGLRKPEDQYILGLGVWRQMYEAVFSIITFSVCVWRDAPVCVLFFAETRFVRMWL